VGIKVAANYAFVGYSDKYISYKDNFTQKNATLVLTAIFGNLVLVAILTSFVFNQALMNFVLPPMFL
jgi:hypothetical protein